MPSCAQLHYKKDQIESCPLGWTRLFYMVTGDKLGGSYSKFAYD